MVSKVFKVLKELLVLLKVFKGAKVLKLQPVLKV